METSCDRIRRKNEIVSAKLFENTLNRAEIQKLLIFQYYLGINGALIE